MRFVSHIRGFGVQIKAPKVRFSNYGDRIVDEDGYIAQFSPDITHADIEWAQREFEEKGFMHGRTLMLDEVTLTPIINRLSVYDTDEAAAAENWTPEFKQEVEEFLLARSDNHPDYRRVEIESVPPPWPTYMNYRGTVPQLIEKLIEDGYSLEHALLFEQRTGKRENVIEALVEALNLQQAEVEDAPVVSA